MRPHSRSRLTGVADLRSMPGLDAAMKTVDACQVAINGALVGRRAARHGDDGA